MSIKQSRATWTRGLVATGAAAAAVLSTTPAQAVEGATAKDSFQFTAKLDIGGERSCSAALVDEQWLITAASCFAENPAEDFKVPAGAPRLKTTATIGRTDLTRDNGAVLDVVELVPRADRDVVLARLAKPVAGVTPVAIAGNAPIQGEELRVSGYGRAKDEWIPDRLHYASFTVGSVKGASLGLNGKEADAVICQGDTGGPAFRDVGGRQELVGVNSRSWQGGCLGTDPAETRKGAVDTRVDDLGGWILQVRSLPKRFVTASGDFDGDGKADLAMLTDYGQTPDGRSRSALWVYTASGEGFGGPRSVWDSGTDSWRWEASKLTTGDFNGDGKTDLAVLYNYGTEGGRTRSGLFTFTNQGTRFDAPKKVWDSSTSSWKSWNWDASKLASGDFNGDGKTDLAVLYNYGKGADGRNGSALLTFSSNGNGVDEPRKVWDSSTSVLKSWNWDTSKLASGDFNGDGKTDLAVLYAYDNVDSRNRTALWFTANDKNGFNEPRKVWDSSTWKNGKDSWSWDASKLASGDFNGDGKTDLAVLYNYGADTGRNRTGLWVFDGSKDGFGEPRKVWDTATWMNGKESWNWASSEPIAGDFNGDGKADLTVTYDYGLNKAGRAQIGLWSFASKGDAFADPRRVWDNGLD
ncbi:FG-GAP-like repeat-containing protein [Streptomyces sp. NPDC037389]|uniref:FG-GAP-like repeat-containing protein n=1 Tax=Streptomyces sp. NPDC037389 TaxID=3155369 RepID=UPI0033C2E672